MFLTKLEKLDITIFFSEVVSVLPVAIMFADTAELNTSSK